MSSHAGVRAIIIACILAGSSTAHVILDSIGVDEISGYIISPVTGLSRIHLQRKLRRQVNLHIPLIPYVESEAKLSPISDTGFGIDDDEDVVARNPITESFFEIDDDDDGDKESVSKEVTS